MAAARGVQLLVFPELSLTGYELDIAASHVIDPDDPVLTPFRALSEQAGMTIVVGAPIRGEAGVLHIGLIALLPGGSVSTYAKVHVHSSEAHVFACGAGGPDLQVDGMTAGLSICRDAAFPEHAAEAASRGVDLYAASVLIDIPGFERKVPLLDGYAREHRFAVLMANYSGVSGGEVSAGGSAIWFPGGEIAARAQGSEEALVIADLGATR